MTPNRKGSYVSDMAVLATGRRDGCPQISTMGNDLDGTQVVMSVTTERAKWYNVGRQPKVAMVVNEGRQQLVLYGTTKRISADPERVEATRKLRTAHGMDANENDDALADQLNTDKRVILKITPAQVTMN